MFFTRDELKEKVIGILTAAGIGFLDILQVCFFEFLRYFVTIKNT